MINTKGIGIIYSKEKYKDLEKIASQNNLYIVYVKNSFEFLDLITKLNPKFLLIDTNNYNTLVEQVKKFLSTYTYMNNKIKFISKTRNETELIDFLNIDDYKTFFFEVNKDIEKSENNFLYLENLRISNFLRELNLSTKQLGFYYIKDIILLAVINEGIPDKLNSTYYQYVALKYKKTISSVSRCVARIIDNTYDEDTKILWSNSLEVKFIKKYKPTSKEFISLIVEKLLSNKKK